MQPFLMGFTPFLFFSGYNVNRLDPGGHLTEAMASLISSKIRVMIGDSGKGPLLMSCRTCNIFI